MGAIGVLFWVMVVLKMFGLISISWFWVFSPIWITVLIGMFIGIVD